MTGTVSNYFSILRYLDQATPCTTGFHPSFDVLWVAGWVAQVRQPSLVLVSSWIGRCWSLKKFIEQWPDDEEFNGHIMEHEIKWTYEANIRSVFCNGMLKYPLVKVRHGRKYEAMISKRVRYGNLISSMNIPLPESQLVYQLDGWRDVWYQHANFGSILLMSLGHLHCLADPCQVIGYGNSVYTYWMVPGFLKHVVTKRIQIDLVAVGSSFSSSAAKLQMHILLAVCVGTLLLFFFWTKTSELQVLPSTGELSVKRLQPTEHFVGFLGSHFARQIRSKSWLIECGVIHGSLKSLFFVYFSLTTIKHRLFRIKFLWLILELNIMYLTRSSSFYHLWCARKSQQLLQKPKECKIVACWDETTLSKVGSCWAHKSLLCSVCQSFSWKPGTKSFILECTQSCGQ